MQHAADKLLTVEEIADLSRIMNIKYGSQLKQRYFSIVSHVDQVVAFATTTLQNSDGSFFYPVEARMAHKEQNISPREAQLFLIDYIDQYFTDFFNEDEGVLLPIDWCTYRCEDFDLQIRGQILNQRAQNHADELLANDTSSDDQ